MKLTNSIRDAFVRAAMDDVPSVDYVEQYRKVMIDDGVAQLPPAVRKVWDNKATRDFVNLAHVGRYGEFSVCVPGLSDHKVSTEAAEKGAALKAQHETQDATRKSLRNKLEQAANSVSTRKALVDMLPEFEKYLPADEAAANRSVPVIANLVADFSKAGWPKGKKRQTASA